MRIFKSIKWRLQLWYGFILVVVLAGFGLTAYQLDSNRQFRQVDQELRHRVGVLGNALHRALPRGHNGDRPPPGPRPREGDLTSRRWTVRRRSRFPPMIRWGAMVGGRPDLFCRHRTPIFLRPVRRTVFITSLRPATAVKSRAQPTVPLCQPQRFSVIRSGRLMTFRNFPQRPGNRPRFFPLMKLAKCAMGCPRENRSPLVAPSPRK